MNIRTYIVDDETLSRETLKSFISTYSPELEVIGEADRIQTAREDILRLRPQLLFLDVEMPYGNAFDLLESLPDIDFEIVFVTAYSHYALQALNLSASYYLLKPIDIDDLVAATRKVKENLERREQSFTTRVLLENIKGVETQQRLVLPGINGFDVIRVQDIMYLVASGNYTEVHMRSGERKVVSKNLKHFEQTLPALYFMRIHKSYLVHVGEIISYHRGKGGYVILSNGVELEVSESRKSALLDYFKQGKP
jgi:two-component system LytT family response regulator